MKFWLTDKESTCFRSIGKFLFTSTSPEIDIDLKMASREELLMLFQNVRYHFIQVEDPVLFNNLFSNSVANQTKHTASKEVKIESVKEPSITDILDKPISTFKSTLTKLSLSDLKKLLEAEKKGKKRPTVISLINKQFKKHQNQVTASIRKIEKEIVEEQVEQYKEDGFAYSNGSLVSDVVESDLEEIVIKLGNDDNNE